MNKDAVTATVIGFVVGLVITSVILFGPTALASVKNLPFLNKSTVKNSILPLREQAQDKDQKPTESVPLLIDSPFQESISGSKELLISGTTFPDSAIVISGSAEDYVTTSSADGKYAGKINLDEGKNDIQVSVIRNNVPVSSLLTVYYTPEQF